MAKPDYARLKPYCTTDKDHELIDILVTDSNRREASESLGLSLKTIENRITRIRRAAALSGYSPEHDMDKEASPAHIVKGTSTLYKTNEEGEKEAVLQWVKTNQKLEDQVEVIHEMVEALKEDIPRSPAVPLGNYKREEQLAVYPIGDPHIGLLCWGEETGEDHDLEIGVEQLCSAMQRLVHTAPPCVEALIVNLGDWYHSDLSDNKTQRSGHHLDVDGRWAKILRYGIKAMRSCIESALDYHEKVTVINAIGNHDDHSSVYLSVCLSHLYEGNPRVTIDTKPTFTHYYRYGKNLIGVHHGHSIKAGSLPLVMAEERKLDWGHTDHRVWLTGHIHHDTKKDFTGCTVETFRTLTARDMYAASHGYMSPRDMKCIVYDPNYGEIERHTVNIAMIRQQQTAA